MQNNYKIAIRIVTATFSQAYKFLIFLIYIIGYTYVCIYIYIYIINKRSFRNSLNTQFSFI